jgi:hypothetical protein
MRGGLVLEGLATPLAHLGHLLIDVPLFLGPIFLLVAALAIHSAHARRHGDTPPDQMSPR